MQAKRSDKKVRFGVSMSPEFKKKLDDFMKKKGYSNRSKFIADWMRRLMMEEGWEREEEVTGVIILIYDHHEGETVKRVLELEHQSLERILSTQHIHLDEHHCLEITVARGRGEEIEKITGRLSSIKGVKVSRLVPLRTG